MSEQLPCGMPIGSCQWCESAGLDCEYEEEQ